MGSPIDKEAVGVFVRFSNAASTATSVMAAFCGFFGQDACGRGDG
jgi:hypothetical protein